MRHPFETGHVEHRVSFHYQATSGEPDVPEPLRARLACHFLLSQLPDEGLSEALESLVQMWQFYRTPVVSPPALPIPAPIPAKFTETYIRPVFPVTEE